jgi:hypothetical protein
MNMSLPASFDSDHVENTLPTVLQLHAYPLPRTRVLVVVTHGNVFIGLFLAIDDFSCETIPVFSHNVTLLPP